MSKTTELLTIQEALTLGLADIINSANELKRIYNKVPQRKIGEVNSGHDAFCEFLRTSCNLVTQSKKLLDKANQDAQRYSAGAGVKSGGNKRRKGNQDAVKSILLEELKGGTDSDPIGLRDPVNAPEDGRQARAGDRKNTQGEVIQLSPIEGRLQQTEGTFDGFSCIVLSIDSGVNYITYDNDRKSLVRSLRAPNGKQLTVKVAQPRSTFEDETSNEIVVHNIPADTIAIPFEKVILVKKQSTLTAYSGNEKTKEPVWPKSTIDIAKATLKPITSSLDSTEKLVTSSKLLAWVSKDRKKVVMLNPEPTEQKAFEVAFNEVRIFSLYSINSEKRRGESVLLVSEKDGSLYQFTSSQQLKAEKPGKLLQIAGLLDVFYAADRLFVLRSDKGKLVVEYYKVSVGDSETPIFKLGSPEKVVDFSIDGDLASDDVRFGIVGELANLAEATVLVFVGKELLKHSIKSKTTDKLLLFNQAFSLNNLIPQVDEIGTVTFVLTSTISKATQFDVHVVSLRFTSYEGVAFDFNGYDDEEMMEDDAQIEY